MRNNINLCLYIYYHVSKMLKVNYQLLGWHYKNNEK